MHQIESSEDLREACEGHKKMWSSERKLKPGIVLIAITQQYNSTTVQQILQSFCKANKESKS